MTEETLAAQLGLRPTWRMRLIWLRLVVMARCWPSHYKRHMLWLARYQQLGEAVVDQISNAGCARAKAQIGLILLSAGVYRDLSCFVPNYGSQWLEALGDAFDYADNMRLDEEVCRTIGWLRFG